MISPLSFALSLIDKIASIAGIVIAYMTLQRTMKAPEAKVYFGSPIIHTVKVQETSDLPGFGGHHRRVGFRLHD